VGSNMLESPSKLYRHGL